MQNMQKQYVGSAKTKFRSRFNNYKTCFRKFQRGEYVPQKLFHAHFLQSCHKGMKDWDITLIEQCESESILRQRESFWQHKLDTFIPKGLNDRTVPIT